MRYVAGYMSKTDQTAPGQEVGRYWGVHNRKELPAAMASPLAFTVHGWHAVRRTARRFMLATRKQSARQARARGRPAPWPRLRNNAGLSLICHADHWLDKLPGIVAGAIWWQLNRA
jgi:hypothetical protein